MAFYITAALHMAVKLTGEKLYGRLVTGHGALKGERGIAV